MQSRLAVLERRRGERDSSGRRLTFAEAFGLPPGTTLCQVLKLSDQIAASPPPTGRPPNQFDVDTYLARLEMEQGE